MNADEDFIPGWFTKFQIKIQDSPNSLPYRYLNCAFETEHLASREVDLILKNRSVTPFLIEVVPVRVRTLKSPIYPF